VFSDCSAYENGDDPLGKLPIPTSCEGTDTWTNLDLPNTPPGTYYGVIHPADQLGHLLVEYYPCGHLNLYRISVASF